MGTARKITVSTSDVTSASNKISGWAEDYYKEYTAMFEKMEGLKGVWNGTDFTEYSNKVLSFKDDFAEMKKALDQYASYLAQAAKAYETAQNSIAEDARKNLKM